MKTNLLKPLYKGFGVTLIFLTICASTFGQFGYSGSTLDTTDAVYSQFDADSLLNGKVDKPLQNQTFTNDSIDCSRTAGIFYDSTIIASNYTLKSKINNRQIGGFVQIRAYGNGTNTITLANDMEYATGQSFDNTVGKKNDITIVFLSSRTYKKYKVFVNN